MLKDLAVACRKACIERGIPDPFESRGVKNDFGAAYHVVASRLGELAGYVQDAAEWMFPDPTGWQTVRPEKKLYI